MKLPLHVAEELRFEQRFGQAGAVDRHERPLGARALRVDGRGDQLLADAALAGDQHLGVGARDALDLLAQLVHRRAAPINRSVPCPFLIISLCAARVADA